MDQKELWGREDRDHPEGIGPERAPKKGLDRRAESMEEQTGPESGANNNQHFVEEGKMG
jgi:hypothetical protein